MFVAGQRKMMVVQLIHSFDVGVQSLLNFLQSSLFTQSFSVMSSMFSGGLNVIYSSINMLITFTNSLPGANIFIEIMKQTKGRQ